VAFVGVINNSESGEALAIREARFGEEALCLGQVEAVTGGRGIAGHGWNQRCSRDLAAFFHFIDNFLTVNGHRKRFADAYIVQGFMIFIINDVIVGAEFRANLIIFV